MKKKKAVLLTSIIALLSCDDNTYSYFPYFPVSFQLNTALDPINKNGYYQKTTIKGIEKIGFGGVLVYHTADDKYVAYDLVCPNELTRTALISAPNSSGIAVCKQCTSEFQILMSDSQGRPLSGPALNKKRRLQQYSVTHAGNVLTVTN
ncbi:MAG: hypothetical protein LBD45_06080 [Bacteroidales bacterium]|jgi:nitrite reductase/ring-hydroxylating ferredoxin subunit|nr:hypothetical protein [Bacteroidales bacterium]